MGIFNNDVAFIVYLVGLSLTAYVKYENPEYIKNIVFSTFNFGSAQSFLKSDINKKSITDILLSINFYLSFSVFFSFFIADFIKINSEKIMLMLPVLVGLSVFLIIYLNAGINILIAYIFKIPDIAEEINAGGRFYYKTAGIFLLFLNIFVSFTEISRIAVYLGFLTIIILYFLRILRIVKINLSKQINGFYMFLYLCTVEIIPLLYLIKIFTILSNNN